MRPRRRDPFALCISALINFVLMFSYYLLPSDPVISISYIYVSFLNDRPYRMTVLGLVLLEHMATRCSAARIGGTVVN
jgi:hypothetical protein